jgi:hypothetical protein
MPKMERNIWKIVFILIFIFSFFGISTDISQKYRKEFEEGEDVLILGLENEKILHLNKTVHAVRSYVIDNNGNGRYEIPTASVRIQPKNLYAVADLEKEKYKEPAIMMTNRQIYVKEIIVEVHIPAEVTITIEPDYRKNQIIGKIQTVPEDSSEEVKDLQGNRIMISKDNFKNLEPKTKSSEISLFYNDYSRYGAFVTYVMVNDPESDYNNKIGRIKHLNNKNFETCEVTIDGKVRSIQTDKLILLDYIHVYTSKNAFTTQTHKQISIPKGIKIQVEVTDDERIGTIQNGESRIKGKEVYIEDEHENSLDLKRSILKEGDYVLANNLKKVGKVTETCSNRKCHVIINGETQLIKRMDLIPINNIIAYPE